MKLTLMNVQTIHVRTMGHVRTKSTVTPVFVKPVLQGCTVRRKLMNASQNHVRMVVNVLTKKMGLIVFASLRTQGKPAAKVRL